MLLDNFEGRQTRSKNEDSYQLIHHPSDV